MRLRMSIIGVVALSVASMFQIGCPKKVETTQETATTARPSEETPRPQERPTARPQPIPEERPRLEEETLPSPPMETKPLPTGLTDVFFDFDQWVLRADARTTLDENARWLRGNPGISIVIEGHCDERGTNEYNLALGERRARAIRSYLVNLGIDPSRLSTISYGEERPFCQDRNDKCFELNRRGHLVRKGS